MRRALFGSRLLLFVLLVACPSTSSDDDAADSTGTTESQAALALTKGLTFEGGEGHDGLLPPATAPDVTVLAPAGDLTLAPGDDGVQLLIEFDNPDEAENAVTDMLVQFEGVESYTSVARDAQAPAGQVETKLSVAGDVCDALCNRTYDLKLIEAVSLKDERIGKHRTRTVKLDCRKAGDAGKCAKKSSGGGTSTPSADSQKLAAQLIDAIVANDHAASCSCDSSADAQSCSAGGDTAGAMAASDCLAAAFEAHSGDRDVVLCSIDWVKNAGACYEAAGCDQAAHDACIPSDSQTKDASSDHHGAPPELIAACHISDAFNADFEKCFTGMGSSSGMDMPPDTRGDGGMSSDPLPSGECPAGVWLAKAEGALTCDGTTGTITLTFEPNADGTYAITQTTENIMGGNGCAYTMKGKASVEGTIVHADFEVDDNGCLKPQISTFMFDAACSTLSTDGNVSVQNCASCSDGAQGQQCMGCGTTTCMASYGAGQFTKQ